MNNKQIEEMAKVIESVGKWEECTFGYYKSKAKALYEAGYRKASEVAEEIFAEIQAEIKAALDSNYKALSQVELSEELWSCVRGKIDCLRGLDDFIDELKKKWEVEE